MASGDHLREQCTFIGAAESYPPRSLWFVVRGTMSVPFRQHLKSFHAGSWPQTVECDSYVSHISSSSAPYLSMQSEKVLSWVSSNKTLLHSLYTMADSDNDLRVGWRALTTGCRVEPLGCWCFHVAGSMVKARNPFGHTRCAPKDRIIDCSDHRSIFHLKAQRVSSIKHMSTHDACNLA